MSLQVFPPPRGPVSDLVSCAAVTATFAVGRRLIKTPAVMREVIAGVCVLAEWNRQECNGIADLHAAPILRIIQQSSLTSEELASLILDRRCMSQERFAKSRLNWQTELPPPLEGERRIRRSNGEL